MQIKTNCFHGGNYDLYTFLRSSTYQHCIAIYLTLLIRHTNVGSGCTVIVLSNSAYISTRRIDTFPSSYMHTQAVKSTPASNYSAAATAHHNLLG